MYLAPLFPPITRGSQGCVSCFSVARRISSQRAGRFCTLRRLMLKLLIFAPCDKVIISAGGQTSLVGVMEEVHVSIAKGKEFGADAMIPYKWNVLTLWAREEDVLDAFTCDMRLIMFRPDGVKALEAEGKFEVSNSFRHFRQNLE